MEQGSAREDAWLSYAVPAAPAPRSVPPLPAVPSPGRVPEQARGEHTHSEPHAPRTVQRHSVRGQILDALRAALVDGELAPGQVYSAPALGARFGVSATPVREAMQQLAIEGAVEVVPNRGFRVSERGPRELAELAEVRALIDPRPSRATCRRFRDSSKRTAPTRHFEVVTDLAPPPGTAADQQAVHSPGQHNRQRALTSGPGAGWRSPPPVCGVVSAGSAGVRCRRPGGRPGTYRRGTSHHRGR